jgi:hypothetical protein
LRSHSKIDGINSNRLTTRWCIVLIVEESSVIC